MRINLRNALGQSNHGCCMIGQASLKSMVVGFGRRIRVKLLVVLVVERPHHTLPNWIFYFENHPRQVIFQINWIHRRFFFKVCWIRRFPALRQTQGQLIDLGRIVVDLPASAHMNYATSLELLHIMRLSIPQFSFDRACLILEDKGKIILSSPCLTNIC